jgi:modulator of FtsH protease
MQHTQNTNAVWTATMNKTLVNTYRLLSATLLFSGIMAYVSMAVGFPHLGLFTLIGYFGLLYAVHKLQNSSYGILAVFALTGFMGLTLGPILNYYLASNPATVMQALAGTGIIFASLSFYAIVSKKDFSFMGGMLMVGIITAFIAMIANIFLEIPALSVTISAVFILLMSGVILFETSNIIHGGQTNYIMATVSLFVAIYNIFLSLLQILGFMGGDD